MAECRWRIGELAELTGMTVRTLHYYEQTGLLRAVERTSGDHRLYDEAGVERLYKIRSLRGLGMTLEEIKQAIDNETALTDILRAHLTHIELEVERMTHLRNRLRNLLSADVNINAAELIVTLNAMSRIERYAHTRQSERLTTTDYSDIELQWRALGDELRMHMNAGDDPSSNAVRAIALKVRERIEAFANGDPRILKALAHLRAADPPQNLAGWDPELMQYLDCALVVLHDA